MSNYPKILLPNPDLVPKTKISTSDTPNYMGLSSQVIGMHSIDDIKSRLRHIVRKVTEKCSTTQELIFHIRKFRMAEDSHFVTPVEFRYVLIKFGVLLSVEVSNLIFQIFDSDRSGTIDFDEFAFWIINSDFKRLDAKIRSRFGVRQHHSKIKNLEQPKITQNVNINSEINLKPIKLTKEELSLLDRSTSDLGAKRRGRECLRSNFKNLTEFIEKLLKDSSSNDKIKIEYLLAAINKFCLPISYSDFYSMIQDFYKNEDNEILWSQFKAEYDPVNSATFSANETFKANMKKLETTKKIHKIGSFF